MKQTSLHDVHVELGARMVAFAGWSMPVQYGSILDEIHTVRTAAGLFDLGHMGRFQIAGPDAVILVDRVCTNHCAKIPVGAIRYSLMCRADGYPMDDLLIYRDEEGVYLVVNAANADEDLRWIRDHAGGLEAEASDLTESTAMLALQGPRSPEILQPLVADLDLASIGYYRFGFGTVCGLPGIRISRTGYTGEDGFEVYLPAAEGPRVWRELRAAGEPHGLAPIGLGARDTLRLEAGMALYGHEIDAEHDPLEAGLGFAIKLTEEKGDFVGRAALERMRAAPSHRRLVGVTTSGPRVPRQGHALFKGDERVGEICSGAKSPTVDANIGTAYVRLGLDRAGEELELDIRGRRQPCVVQELPFFSRTRK
ncbi:MAG: glycine cleavage system aminomethyltransferase GcvT [Planctomycetota bacterium]|nr:glycine cleavage system aminomethyltransferase GcvT [Planctomycetota bacterium]